MTNEEILEGNRLILEFEGFKFVSDDTESYPNGYYYKKDEGYHTLEECRFNESWDWLMPVVRKIVELAINDDIEGGNLFLSNEYTSILETISLAVIEDSYKVVVEFIKYYNTCQDSQKTLQKL